jgi:Flp pilus assembly protein TadG
MTPNQHLLYSMAPTEVTDRRIQRKSPTRVLVAVAPNSGDEVRVSEIGMGMHRNSRFTRLSLKLAASRSGLGAIEFALVAGILCTLVLGVLDFGVGFWEQTEVGNAARAGAEYARQYGFAANSIQTAVTSATSLSSITASPAPVKQCGCPNASTGVTVYTCGNSCPGGGTTGTYVVVNAHASYSTIFTWPGISNPMTLASTAVVRID